MAFGGEVDAVEGEHSGGIVFVGGRNAVEVAHPDGFHIDEDLGVAPVEDEPI